MNAKIEIDPRVADHETTLHSIAGHLVRLGHRVNSHAGLHLSDQERALTDLLDALEGVRARLVSARDTAAELAEGDR